ncbi:ankyrin [Marasmius fiardii PR-910]|nr:ankyrin [Marasmius fiardii PR-910]
MTQYRSQFNFGLQSSALHGDCEGVEYALQAGADVNILDASGRGAVMCVIAGEHWNDIVVSSVMTSDRVKILELLLDYAGTSLYAFNAPQKGFNGVTPLGMAAWLNSEIAVRLLLDNSSGVVDVDGMDTHGATPLMYAARDGNLEIVRILLQHGARPDFRDKNHRTSVQYALQHPQILHYCESILHHHRQHENRVSSTHHALSILELIMITDLSLPQTPSSEHLRPTTSLLAAVVSSDVSSVKNLLSLPSSNASTPILVNQPDAHGWSPIHHCSSARNISREILDSLYCAGADVSLFTSKEQYTPLHCLAFSNSIDVYDFAIHLIRDLRAPLSATDRKGATCIHVAAEHGSNVDLLKAFLECDTTGRIREMRDNNGMTPLDLAKPHFREVFGLATDDLRPESSLSVSTIRPRLSSFPSLDCAAQSKQNDDAISLCDFDVVTAAHQLIDNLRITSPSLYHDYDSDNLNHIENLIRETSQLSVAIIRNFRSRSEYASRAVKNTIAESSIVDDLLWTVSLAAEDKLVVQGLGDMVRDRRSCHRESQDSQLTAVSVMVTEAKREPSSPVGEATQVQRELEKSVQKVELDSEKDKSSSSGASSFFKGWFKRKTPKETQGKEDQASLSSPPSPVSRVPSSSPPVKSETASEVQSWLWQSTDITLRSSPIVLEAARQEIDSVKEGLISASQFIDSSEKSITRAERIIAKAIKKRKCMLADLRTWTKNQVHKDLFIRPRNGSSHSLQVEFGLSSKPSISSLCSVSTVNSGTSAETRSPTSIEAVVAENDDEETKAIRRLILRKFEATMDGALDEVEKAAPKLCVAKETIRGVKRRAGLDVSRTR